MKITKLIVLVLLSIALFGCDFIYENPIEEDTDTSSDLDTDSEEVELECNLECLPGWKCISDQCVEVFAEDQGNVSAMATDETYIYWSDPGTFDHLANYNFDGRIVRVSKDGGEPEVLASDLAGPNQIFVDDTHVYWLGGDYGDEGESVQRVAKAGGEPEVLANPNYAADIRSVGATDTHVFWSHRLDETTDAYAIYSVPKDLSTSPSIWHQEPDQIRMIYVAEDTLYWQAITQDDIIEIKAAPIGDPTQAEILASIYMENLSTFAVSSTDLFWAANYDISDGIDIHKKALDNPGVNHTTLCLAEPGWLVTSLFPDDGSIYYGRVDDNGGAAILQTPVEPGHTTVILDGLIPPIELTVDDTHFFAATEGNIIKIEK